jgi:Rrf2 family protein
MNITLEADYALRIVYVFSCNNVKTDAPTLSEKIGVSLRFTLKILRKLLLAGIVRSYKGKSGGYMLAKMPEEISMYDVITAIEGEIPVNRCTCEDYECGHPDVKQGLPCPVRHVFIDMAEDLHRRLGSIDFQQVVEGKAKY